MILLLLFPSHIDDGRRRVAVAAPCSCWIWICCNLGMGMRVVYAVLEDKMQQGNILACLDSSEVWSSACCFQSSCCL
jgi:hypothetical protein